MISKLIISQKAYNFIVISKALLNIVYQFVYRFQWISHRHLQKYTLIIVVQFYIAPLPLNATKSKSLASKNYYDYIFSFDDIRKLWMFQQQNRIFLFIFSTLRFERDYDITCESVENTGIIGSNVNFLHNRFSFSISYRIACHQMKW